MLYRCIVMGIILIGLLDQIQQHYCALLSFCCNNKQFFNTLLIGDFGLVASGQLFVNDFKLLCPNFFVPTIFFQNFNPLILH